MIVVSSHRNRADRYNIRLTTARNAIAQPVVQHQHVYTIASLHSTTSSKSEDCQEGRKKCNGRTTLDDPVASILVWDLVAGGVELAL